MRQSDGEIVRLGPGKVAYSLRKSESISAADKFLTGLVSASIVALGITIGANALRKGDLGKEMTHYEQVQKLDQYKQNNIIQNPATKQDNLERRLGGKTMISDPKVTDYVTKKEIKMPSSQEEIAYRNRVKYINELVRQECARYNLRLDKNSKEYKVTPQIIEAIIQRESNYTPNTIHYKAKRNPTMNPAWIENMRLPKKQRNNKIKRLIFEYKLDKDGKKIPTAYGLCGIAQKTAETYGVPLDKIMNPQTNIQVSIRAYSDFLKQCNGNVKKALAMYNIGPKFIKNHGYQRALQVPQTGTYVDAVVDILRSKLPF